MASYWKPRFFTDKIKKLSLIRLFRYLLKENYADQKYLYYILIGLYAADIYQKKLHTVPYSVFKVLKVQELFVGYNQLIDQPTNK